MGNRGEEPERRSNGRSPLTIGAFLAIGTGVGTALFAATGEPVWIAVGAAIGAGQGAATQARR